ncbi:hypothetical protein FDZ71_02600 [bacterium]|nr:MAG: hypothetical protein FDZ71_02600 [bacterium]
MKIKAVVLTLSLFAVASSALAMDHGAMKMGGAAPKGVMIRDVKVDGYQMSYHLIDNAAEMAKSAKGMEMDHSKMEMKSHHLMLYLADPKGVAVKDATVGYLTVSPAGDKAQAMAMAMEGGYGADVELKSKGKYTVKAKAVIGQKTLIDEFSYEIK